MTLTKHQKQILKEYFEYNWTIKKIAYSRKISVQAVYKTISQIKKKGMWNKVFLRFKNDETYTQPSTKQIRLHGQHFIISILSSELKNYRSRFSSGDSLILDGNTIEFNFTNIEVYSNTDFYGKDVDECQYISQEYWLRFFYRLESRIKVFFLKDGFKNIRLVNRHYSDIDNELAKDRNKYREKIKIPAKDGKIWSLIDKSMNFNEFETVHPITSKTDMKDVIIPFFNGLKDHYDQTGETITLNQLLLSISGLSGLITKQSELMTKLLQIITTLTTMNNNNPCTEDPDNDKSLIDYIN